MNRIWIVVFIISQLYSLMIISCSDDINPPPASTRLVVLYYPENDVILPDTPITFTWGTTSENADSFKFQITQDSGFVANVENYGVNVPQYRINPVGDTDYFYWRVTAFWRSHGDSDVSSTRKFKQR